MRKYLKKTNYKKKLNLSNNNFKNKFLDLNNKAKMIDRSQYTFKKEFYKFSSKTLYKLKNKEIWSMSN